VLSPVTGLFCHRHSREVCPGAWRQRRGARTTRFRSSALAGIRRPPTSRPPHPTATFVTCATPLLSGGTRRLKSLICPTTEAEYFFARGWTDFWWFARRVTWSQAVRPDLTCATGASARS